MYSERLEAAVEAARRAGQRLLDSAGFAVEQKAPHDYVTEMDRATERALREALLGRFPEDGFYGEEGGESARARGRWIVDPIDGTTNFIKGIPLYTLSLAYESDGVLELGVVYCPRLGELYTARRGRGAQLNGRPIRVSGVDQPGQAVAGMSFAHRCPEDAAAMQALLPSLVTGLSDLRRTGSAALDLSWVACGRCEAFLELGLHLYDIAAGLVILREAGGRATGWPGGPACEQSGDVLATNGRLHPWFERALSPYAPRREAAVHEI